MDTRKAFIKFSLFAGISALIAGIYMFYKYQIKQALSYCYKIANISILKVSTSLISLKVFVKIQNKSSFFIELKGYDFDIYVNSLYVANVKSDNTQIIANNAISDINFQIDFDPGNIFKVSDIALIVGYFLTDKSKIVISIKGNFVAKMNFIRIKMPVDFKMTLAELMSTDSQSESKKTICDIK